jgi:hypothetical protein
MQLYLVRQSRKAKTLNLTSSSHSIAQEQAPQFQCPRLPSSSSAAAPRRNFCSNTSPWKGHDFLFPKQFETEPSS